MFRFHLVPPEGIKVAIENPVFTKKINNFKICVRYE